MYRDIFKIPTPEKTPTFLLGLIFLFLSGAVLLVFVLFSGSRNKAFRVDSEIIQKNETLAHLAAQAMELQIQSIFSLGNIYVSKAPFKGYIQEKKWQEAIDSLKAIMQEKNGHYVDLLFITDADGIALSNFPKAQELLGKDFSFRDWYQGVTTTQKPYLSEVYQRAAKPQVRVHAFAFPIFDENSKIQAIVGMQVRADTFWKWLDDINFDLGKRLFSVDHTGKVISHRDYPYDSGVIDYSSEDDVQEILRGKSGSEIIIQNGQQFLSSYVALAQYGGGIVVRVPIAEMGQAGMVTFSSVSSIFVSVFIVLLVASIGVLFWFSLTKILRKNNE